MRWWRSRGASTSIAASRLARPSTLVVAPWSSTMTCRGANAHRSGSTRTAAARGSCSAIPGRGEPRSSRCAVNQWSHNTASTRGEGIPLGQLLGVAGGEAGGERDLGRHDPRAGPVRRGDDPLHRHRVAEPVPLRDLGDHPRQQHVGELAAHDRQRGQFDARLEQCAEVGERADRQHHVGLGLLDRGGQCHCGGFAIGIVVDPGDRCRVVDDPGPFVAEHHPPTPWCLGGPETGEHGQVRCVGGPQQRAGDAGAKFDIAEHGRDADEVDPGVAEGIRHGEGVVDVGPDVGVDPEPKATHTVIARCMRASRAVGILLSRS